MSLSEAPLSCFEAPITEVDILRTDDTHIEEMHGVARSTVHLIQSMQPPGFHGSSYGVQVEDPTVGVYMAGWDTVEVRREIEQSPRLWN